MKKNFISKSLNKYETLRKTSNTSERDRVHLPYLGIAAAAAGIALVALTLFTFWYLGPVWFIVA